MSHHHILLALFFLAISFGSQLNVPPSAADQAYDRHHEEVHSEKPHMPDEPVLHFGRLQTCRGWRFS